jgi:hypothetical protein
MLEKRTVVLYINSVYLPEEPWQQVSEIQRYFGFTLKNFLTHSIHGFLSRNQEYYIEAALIDAAAREMTPQEHYRALRDGIPLKPVVRHALLPQSPLQGVACLKSPETFRHSRTVELSEFDAILFRLALQLEGETAITVTSQIVLSELAAHWGHYHRQILSAEQENYLVEEGKDGSLNS